MGSVVGRGTAAIFLMDHTVLDLAGARSGKVSQPCPHRPTIFCQHDYPSIPNPHTTRQSNPVIPKRELLISLKLRISSSIQRPVRIRSFPDRNETLHSRTGGVAHSGLSGASRSGQGWTNKTVCGWFACAYAGGWGIFGWGFSRQRVVSEWEIYV